jgi:hypothetical protein
MKMKRWRGIESICVRLNKKRNRAWVCCVFFTKTKQNVLFGFCKIKHSKPDFCEKSIEWEKWVWVAVYGFAVFGFCEKCRGFGFLCMGCPAKRWIGREGNGAEGCLRLNERMGFFEFAVIATVAK